MKTPAEKLCDRSWRLRNTIWLLGPILSLGLGTWASLWYVGAKSGKSEWKKAAWAFGAAAALMMVAQRMLSDGDKATSTSGDTVGGLIVMAVWISGITYCVRANRAWLTWKAHDTGAGAWYSQTGEQQLPTAATSPSVDDILLGRPLGNRPARLDESTAPPSFAAPPPPFAAPPPSLLAPPPPPPPFTAPPVPPAPMAPLYATNAPGNPIDVNQATAAQMASHLGLSVSVAERVVAERSRAGGFTDLDQMMTVGGLQPHVFAGIRDRLTITTPPPLPPTESPATRSSGRGRRLDI